jgi:DNA-binding NarL/FixJ family response regulator
MLPLSMGAQRARARGKKVQIWQQASSSMIGGILERSILETLSSQLNGMFAGPVGHKNNGTDQTNAAHTRLSKRQMEVLKLLGQGKTNKEIAMALFLSPNTIKLHVSAILERLRLKSRTQAALLSSKLLQDNGTADPLS